MLGRPVIIMTIAQEKSKPTVSTGEEDGWMVNWGDLVGLHMLKIKIVNS